MTALTLCALALTLGVQPYDKAFDDAQAKGQPLLVLVGAEWCPGCVTMKERVLPKLEQAGKLGRVSLTVVDADADADLAGRLMRGNAIPQLIVFSKKADGGWHREQLTGAVAGEQVEALIDRAIGQQAQVDAPAATTAQK
ncbi:MAG: thioredoxin family protein [Pirellulaceae bacterium]|nr:thioredoxin family protein [Pirellulaceae bacterium]